MSEVSKRSSVPQSFRKDSGILTPDERKALADLAPRPAYILPIEALAIGGPRRLLQELGSTTGAERPTSLSKAGEA